jgi:DNA-binding LacI/PurR family transcriptional regulator
LALIHGDLKSSATRERVEGFVDQCKQLGFPFSKTQSLTRKNEDHLHIGLSCMEKLLSRQKSIDAVFVPAISLPMVPTGTFMRIDQID